MLCPPLSSSASRCRVCYDKRGRRRRNVNRTLAHRDHIHFGLSRAGAAGRTSWWERTLRRR